MYHLSKDKIYLIRTRGNHDNSHEYERLTIKLGGDVGADELLEQVYYFMLGLGYHPEAVGRTFQEMGDMYGPRDESDDD
jgi:hypothetical protein